VVQLEPVALLTLWGVVILGQEQTSAVEVKEIGKLGAQLLEVIRWDIEENALLSSVTFY